MMTLLPYAIIWALLAAVVIALAVARKVVSNREDDTLHVSEASQAALGEQAVVSHKLDVIDKWGKSLTVVVVLSGLALGAAYIWVMWQESAGYVVR